MNYGGPTAELWSTAVSPSPSSSPADGFQILPAIIKKKSKISSALKGYDYDKKEKAKTVEKRRLRLWKKKAKTGKRMLRLWNKGG